MTKEDVLELKELLFGCRGNVPRYDQWEIQLMREWAFKCGAVERPSQFVYDPPTFIWGDAAFEKFDHLTRVREYKTNKRKLLLCRR